MGGLGTGTRSPAGLTLIDAGNERAPMRFYGKLLTAGNFVAQFALWNTFLASIQTVCLGAIQKSYYGDSTTYMWTQPTNGALRETKLLIKAQDAVTGAKWSYPIYTIDPAIPVYIVNNSLRDAIDPSAPSSIVDLLTAFDAFCISPDTGNALQSVGLAVKRGLK